ncbi:macrodontain-1-like [Syzygium oleosum]|uniref:macrodontain-1-like n=1 Tax=Syzygium oleosum TaxID=219896 RepID=UPI0024BB0E98|nr:macrodontain-1-like [Syzygium oleosum]
MAFKLAKNFSIWFILVFCACASTSDSASLADDIPSSTKKFEEWMTGHGRDYKDVAEKVKRFQIFLENLKFVEEFKRTANRTYKVGLNKFSDLTNEEFRATYAGYKSPSSTRSNSSQVHSFEYQGLNSIPERVNWVEQGAVNPIKLQGPCGSSWAFSVVATVEAITKIKSGMLPNLSVQQLLDCATNGGNWGCHGGLMDNGFKYIIENEGISSTSNYPYTGVDGTCDKQAASVVEAIISAYRDVPAKEDDMLKAVAMQPVSVALDSSGPAFQNYAGGVFNGPCDANLDHAVTVVGYGTDEEGTKYWLVRNSWDAPWGESGYMRIQRDSGVEGGLCGIALKVSYPIYQRDYGLELMCVSRLNSADMN